MVGPPTFACHFSRRALFSHDFFDDERNQKVYFRAFLFFCIIRIVFFRRLASEVLISLQVWSSRNGKPQATGRRKANGTRARKHPRSAGLPKERA